MVKIVLDAGHGNFTAGKRCLKAIDPNETREWFLNQRIANYIEELLKAYENVEILRVDDRTGASDADLSYRCNAANKWGADIYISIHHNAGINGSSGGGITVYRYPNSSKTSRAMLQGLYDSLIAHTGLKGNRSQPLNDTNFYVLRETKMPAILIEHGFMDSKTDVPIILTEKFARQCAAAHVEFYVKHFGLKKKVVVNPAPAPAEPKEDFTGYRLVVGYYENYDNAKAQLEKAKAFFPSAFLAKHKK